MSELPWRQVALARQMNITYAAGVDSTGTNVTSGIAEAVTVAKDADLAIVFVGLTPCNGWVKGDTCNGNEASLPVHFDVCCTDHGRGLCTKGFAMR